MSRLIYVDRLKKDILALQDCYNGFSDTYDKACIIGVIDEQPTIEPERKKGEWRLLTNGNAICSECGYTQVSAWDMDGWDNFCHHCGSDMREEGDHE